MEQDQEVTLEDLMATEVAVDWGTAKMGMLGLEEDLVMEGEEEDLVVDPDMATWGRGAATEVAMTALEEEMTEVEIATI